MGTCGARINLQLMAPLRMLCTGLVCVAAMALAAAPARAYAASSTPTQQCHSISPNATDAWCNENCNQQPPNCAPTPAQLILDCTGGSGSSAAVTMINHAPNSTASIRRCTVDACSAGTTPYIKCMPASIPRGQTALVKIKADDHYLSIIYHPSKGSTNPGPQECWPLTAHVFPKDGVTITLPISNVVTMPCWYNPTMAPTIPPPTPNTTAPTPYPAPTSGNGLPGIFGTKWGLPVVAICVCFALAVASIGGIVWCKCANKKLKPKPGGRGLSVQLKGTHSYATENGAARRDAAATAPQLEQALLNAELLDSAAAEDELALNEEWDERAWDDRI